jgi:RNA polymerase sigma-70 factor (ECF subfamily)
MAESMQSNQPLEKWTTGRTAAGGLASLSDEALVARTRRGDAAAFGQIMRRNNRRLFRVAHAILKDHGEAEETVQEAYIRAYDRLDGFRGEAALSTWLAKIAANEALSRLRRRRPTVSLSVIPGGLDHPAIRTEATLVEPAKHDPEAAAARGEIRTVLERAIEELPCHFRSVFVLRAVEEFSVKDTADCLGIPRETVKTRFFRAKRLLRENLNQSFDAGLTETFPFGGARCDRIVVEVLRRLGLTDKLQPTSEI